MDFTSVFILFVTGVAAGFLNVMAGGGSLLAVPVMVFLGLPGPVANGTNRIAILTQNISAVTAFRRGGFSDFRLSLTLALASLPGAVAGALLGAHFGGVWFNRVLAIIMVCVMILSGLPRKSRPGPVSTGPITKKRLIAGHLAVAAAGAYGGFIQVGVGFILIPILQRILGLDLVRVNMHKVFIAGFYTVAALTVFAIKSSVAWVPGLCLAAGASIGGWLGAHTSIKRGERLIRWILNIVLAIFAVKLLFF